MTKELKYISTVLYFIVFPLLALSQDANTPQEAYSCVRPQYRDIKDRHQNCRDMYNRKMGLWKTYSYSHVLISEITYENDKKHGSAKRYYPHSGALMEWCDYYYGIRDGEFKNYYYSGAPKTEGNYVMGNKDGMWTKFHLTGGEVASEGQYSKGKKVGLWKFYNTKGDLVKTIGYGSDGIVKSINGVPVESISKPTTGATPQTTVGSPKVSGGVSAPTAPSGNHKQSTPNKGKPKVN